MLRPLQDRIVVKPEVINLSEVLIVKNSEKFNRGEIVAVGDGKVDKYGKRQPMDAKPGQKIRYGNGTYLDWPIIEHDGEKYQIIQEADICWIEE